MIKINLLPKSIGQSTLSQVTAGIFTFLMILIIGGLLGYYHMVLVPMTLDKEKQAKAAEDLQAKVASVQAEASAQTDLVAPINAKVTFINDVLKYNTKYPELFEKVAGWTYDQIVLSSMNTSGGTLTMSARAKSLEDLGRYLLNMYRATDLFTSVSISNVPSYPGKAAVPNNGRGPIIQTPLDFTVTCQLKETFSPPTPPSGGGSSSASSGGGAPAMGGGMPGMGGGMPGAGGGMPGMKGGMPGMGGGMPGAGGGMPGMKGGMPGAGGGMPGMKGGMPGGMPIPPSGGGMPPGAKGS